MPASKLSKWNTLEAAKLLVSSLVPLLLFWLTVNTDRALAVNRQAIERASEHRAQSERRQLAVRDLARFIYERRARSELLASSLRRKADLAEVRERKSLYDDAYFRWNANHQANLLLIREVLGETHYESFQALLESYLVKDAFQPLDQCLTAAYDARVRSRDPQPILQNCNSIGLIQRTLDCGFALTDALFRLSSAESEIPRDWEAQYVAQRCAAN